MHMLMQYTTLICDTTVDLYMQVHELIRSV